MTQNISSESMYSRFDSHSLVKGFIKAGMKEPLAEKVVEAISQTREFDLSNLATKTDVALVKQEVVLVEQRMKTELEKVKNDILKWMIPFMLTNTLAVIGVVISLFLKQ